MGLSCGLVIASDACAPNALDLAQKIGLIGPGSVAMGRGLLWDGAGRGKIALLQVPGWLLILLDVGTFVRGDLSAQLSAVSIHGEVFVLISESTSGGLGFELYEHRELRRKWLEVEGVVDANVGMPLPREPPGVFTFDPDENGDRDFWKIVAVAEGVTGLNWNSLQEATADIHRTAVP